MIVFEKQAQRLRESIDEKGAEWISALFMLGWCLALALPGDTLGGAAYSGFHRASFMTETFWACVFGVVGSARVTALYLNGDMKRGPALRIISSAFGVLTWTQVSFLFLGSGLLSTGTMTTGPIGYGILALFDFYSLVRVASDAKYQRQ